MLSEDDEDYDEEDEDDDGDGDGFDDDVVRLPTLLVNG
jgi:hypothetical protein